MLGFLLLQCAGVKETLLQIALSSRAQHITRAGSGWGRVSDVRQQKKHILSQTRSPRLVHHRDTPFCRKRATPISIQRDPRPLVQREKSSWSDDRTTHTDKPDARTANADATVKKCLLELKMFAPPPPFVRRMNRLMGPSERGIHPGANENEPPLRCQCIPRAIPHPQSSSAGLRFS